MAESRHETSGQTAPPAPSEADSPLARAATLALEWHAGHTRKGSRIPYSSHLFQVMGAVLEHGGDTTQAIAALFHDALEDAPSAKERSRREARIRGEFGGDVLEIVLDCTDTTREESLEQKAAWRTRKTRFLASLQGAGQRSVLVVACDKRHNLHSLVWDVRAHGSAYLERFNAAPADQLWYFESVVSALGSRIPRRLEAELRDLVGEFQALAAAADSGAAGEESASE